MSASQRGVHIQDTREKDKASWLLAAPQLCLRDNNRPPKRVMRDAEKLSDGFLPGQLAEVGPGVDRKTFPTYAPDNKLIGAEEQWTLAYGRFHASQHVLHSDFQLVVHR